jgi:hypothetical protein
MQASADAPGIAQRESAESDINILARRIQESEPTQNPSTSTIFFKIK